MLLSPRGHGEAIFFFGPRLVFRDPLCYEELLMKIRFGHSPDPDDAFMFYAVAHRLINLKGFEIEHVVEDIESLNRRALTGELEVTAVSVHAYAHLADRYAILRSGASMGEHYGPIVVSKTPIRAGDLKDRTIAVPGELTTAFLALRLFEPRAKHVVVPFDQIMDYVSNGKSDVGLLIHEGQLTYRKHGLNKVIDLGEWWWDRTHLPLPLGVDVIRKDLGAQQMKSFSGVFQKSIEYSLEHRDAALEYALPYGRGLTRASADEFVGMYVNDYTRGLGSKGERAISELLHRAYEAKLVPKNITPEFV